MIIDVSRKPLLILPDEMADQVIIRSIGNREVTGLVTFDQTGRYEKRKIVDVTPEAVLHQGTIAQFETRLPLPGAPYRRGVTTPYPVPPRQWQPYTVLSRGPERESAETPPPVELAPEPYEVASVFRDLVTDYRGSWRLMIRIEKHKNGKIWIVSVWDAGGTVNLVLATKYLDPNPTVREKLPLNRAAAATATATVWDRIRDVDDD